MVNGYADDGVTSDLAMERGGVRSLAFEVQETVLLSPSTEPEPARPICTAADAFWPPCGTDLCNRAA